MGGGGPGTPYLMRSTLGRLGGGGGSFVLYLLTGVSFSSNLEEGRQLQRGGGWSELGPEGARPEPSPLAMRPEVLTPHLPRTLAWQ